MIDELLGRATLKDRIADLEEENERLRRRYEAESDRRSEAVTARQTAEREQNRLEDRIAQLEGELERLRADRTDADLEIDPRRRDRIRGAELSSVLERLESFRTGPEGALTAVVPTDDGPDSAPDVLTEVLGERMALLETLDPAVVCVDDAELVAVALSPPVDPRAAERDARRSSDGAAGPHLEWDDRFRLERSWFLPHGRFTLSLVRADLFALGVYDGGDRLDYRGFESDVKGRHSKGGFSQGRFERIRDGQIADHLERCRSEIADRRDGPLYLVGQDEAVSRLIEHGVEPTATATVDATGKPKAALEDAFRSFFTTELIVL
ncbi:Vms1/Ankzf1 family peptidyl-tRNA hydrolase [Natronosalvus caseinilyticus]|uniref:Vms1/Ankzf1 family peptidyl-tRNA hydrolase n=1 Tax=Natronosalvus caseinilyticus TaxID=2953747 RepID=UPI0028ADF83F|nr:Vms1/Ankzf1 family peptidyl-tRNA hydrolase [Natronosalvus caseinilyticus]